MAHASPVHAYARLSEYAWWLVESRRMAGVDAETIGIVETMRDRARADLADAVAWRRVREARCG